MMKFESIRAALLLALSLTVLAGCDQAEKNAQQLMGKAAESAKQAIDETHKAAEQALRNATQGVIGNKEKPTGDSGEKTESSQAI